jgi:hypothetical protein
VSAILEVSEPDKGGYAYAAQRSFGLQPQELIQSQEFFIPLLQRTFPVRRLRLFQKRALFPFGNHPDGQDGNLFHPQGLCACPQTPA